MPPAVPPLPIDDALPALRAALAARPVAVLQAPPGAGKTTRVPLALLDAPWLDGRKLVMLEPRRLAARAAARRMAQTLGERVGETVGHRVRMDTRVGARTRIEVVTEGVLTRLLQDDPTLDAYGAVVFDEYHERSLHADLGLALVLQARQLVRDDLRVLVMSATLEGARVAALLGRSDGDVDAPIVTSEGRSFPVEVRWRPVRPEPRQLEGALATTVRQALAAHDGDVLAFLPGAGEIARAHRILDDGTLPRDVTVHALHGTLAGDVQDAAIAPSPPGTRKVVLATSIAETSLTIEGVRVVVDAGLARGPRFDPRTGMTRLETGRVSQAGATQRAGRAGRVAPGVCYRLWPEAEHAGLLAHATPEIRDADLVPLALDLAVAGVRDADELLWLDPPPAPAVAQARALLAQLGALDADGRVTPHGRRMAALPLHPRLAHLCLVAADLDAAALACDLAALLAERDVLRAAPTSGGPPRFPDADVRLRLDLVRGGGIPAAVHGWEVDAVGVRRARDEARALRERLRGVLGQRVERGEDRDDLAGVLLAHAYPDRIAQRRAPAAPGDASREPAGRFLLRSGRGATLDPSQPLAREGWLAVAELGGMGGDPRVLLAAPLTRDEIAEHFAAQLETVREVAWDDAAGAGGAGAVRAREVVRLGALTLRERALRDVDPEAVAHALAGALRADGIVALPWSDAARALRERVAFARTVEGADAWPDWHDDALLASLDDWLAPHLVGLRSRADVARLDLAEVLRGTLSWTQRQALDALAPTHLEVPSGARHRVDYADPSAPVLAVRLQELFGMAETPRVGKGRVAVVVHLLSPAHRPVQVTRDLAGFWRTSYHDVRKDLRGRYPKHDWPEDPLTAVARKRR